MLPVLAAFFASLVVSLLIVATARRGSHASMDADLAGAQKFHARAVPRIGGAGVVVGVGAALWVFAAQGQPGVDPGWWLWVCAAPAFGAGLAEDFTKRVGAAPRLLFTAVSAGLAYAVLGAAIGRSDIPGVDTVLAWPAGSFVLTVLAVSGMANSVNIIDGFNGLASMCSMLMLAGLAYVAFAAGDPAVGHLCVVGIAATLGFFVWNFPAGLIFLGDGGAYFLGYFIAECAILLVARNPEVSPLFPLLACIYPIFETLFSIYRRRFIRATPPSMPDGIHLHSLVYRRVMRWAVGARGARSLTRRNSMTSPYLWMLCMSSLVPAVLFWNHSGLLAAFIGMFALTYIVMYWRIVRFKTPRWMFVRH